jgi:signal transduction histidine kinase
MSKILEKNWTNLRKGISLRQFREWVTASKYKYQKNILARTWLNIVVFHTVFVAVMVGVFAYLVHTMQIIILNTVHERLDSVLPRGMAGEMTILQTSLDSMNLVYTFILVGIVFFAFFCAAFAAQKIITPTRDEHTQHKSFISSLAHEMRTPLSVLLTNNEVALYDVHDAELKKVLDDNIEEVKNITDILNNLLLFNKFNSQASLTFESVETEPIIDSVIKRLAPYAQKHRVSIEQTIHGTSPVHANETALELVLYNLIKNAIIYSKSEGGSVHLTQSITGNQLIISVEDTGVGIAESNFKQIFEPFFKVKDTDIQYSGGSGLGLSLVAEVTKLHRGSIHVESSKGVMTRFTLALPTTP